jgi:hypothetical protein
VMPPARATAEKVTRSISSIGSSRFVLEMAEFSSIHF